MVHQRAQCPDLTVDIANDVEWTVEEGLYEGMHQSRNTKEFFVSTEMSVFAIRTLHTFQFGRIDDVLRATFRTHLGIEP